MTVPPDHPASGLHWRGFTTQLFLLTILPLAVLILAITFGSQALHHEAMRSMVGDRDLRAARAAANSLSEQLTHRALAVQMLAAQAGDNTDLSALMMSIHGLNDDFEGGLALIDPSGKLVRTTEGSPLASLDAQQLAQPVGSITIDPATGGPAFSAPFQTKNGQEPYWVMAAHRTPQGGLLVGVFTPLALARQALNGAVDPAQASVVLAAPGGVTLYQSGPLAGQVHLNDHPGISSSLQGESGIDYLRVGSDEHVVAFAPIPPLGWGLMLEESWESIASPLLNTTQATPLVLAPLLLLALVALWFGARQIVRPLQTLQSSTSRLAQGDFEAIKKPVGGISEIRALQEDLEQMAAELQAAQASLHGYISAITAGVENERLSLARELHDDTLQALIALQQRVQLASLNGKDQRLADVQQLVGQTIDNLRRMVRGLRPIYLEDLGLSAALNMLAQETASASAIEIGFTCQGEETRQPAEVELMLYRMAQETLSNVTRHSHARHARLEIAYQPHRLTLTVSDDGQGFEAPASPSEFARQGHYGLVGLHERAEIIRASLEIESKPGQGTMVRVRKDI